MKIDFDNVAPEARRIILVSSDAKYTELIRQIDWSKVLKLLLAANFPLARAVGAVGAVGAVAAVGAVGAVGAVLGPAVARSEYLAATWAATSSTGTASSNQNWLEKLTTHGEIPIPHLSPEEAARRFRFDFGEPKDGSAYVLDPCIADHYLVPATAHERLAQEKLGAFMQIAAALGAKRIELVTGEVLKSSAGVNADVPVAESAAQIGLGIAFDGNHKVTRQVFMEFDAPERAPYVPSDLSPWVEFDPGLRALVNIRLTARPRNAKVSLRFEESFDIDATATADLAKRKIGVGGKYQQLRASLWSFDLEFWPT